MVVRIRLTSSPPPGADTGKLDSARLEPGDSRPYQEAALALAALLTPAALIAFSMAFWSIAADLRWTTDFVISNGLLSHWQIWLATAALLLLLARVLDRYGRGENSSTLSNVS